MTISSFCHEQLRERGPLSHDALTALAVEAGVTAARNPAGSVRTAIGDNAALLPDGRWAAPATLLEGRWLTTRDLRPSWPAEPGYVANDLAPLRFLQRSQPIPLASGGVLPRWPYDYRWEPPRDWAELDCDEDQVVGLQLRGGVLHSEVLDETRAMRDAGQALALALGRIRDDDHYWRGVHTVESNLLARLWELTSSGSEVLLRPALPLSECVPALAAALREELQARQAEAQHWRSPLDLPAELRHVARRTAERDGLLLDDWLNAFVADALRALDLESSRAGNDHDRVRPLLRLF